MTLREHLFNLPDKELADYLVTALDEDDDDDFVRMWWYTTDGQQFWIDEYEDAIEHQVELLNSEYIEGDEHEN